MNLFKLIFDYKQLLTFSGVHWVSVCVIWPHATHTNHSDQVCHFVSQKKKKTPWSVGLVSVLHLTKQRRQKIRHRQLLVMFLLQLYNFVPRVLNLWQTADFFFFLIQRHNLFCVQVFMCFFKLQMWGCR